jgi:hypothetical protein
VSYSQNVWDSPDLGRPRARFDGREKLSTWLVTLALILARIRIKRRDGIAKMGNT